jgi:hypothetical protein
LPLGLPPRGPWHPSPRRGPRCPLCPDAPPPGSPAAYLAISKDITAIKGAINSRTPNWNKAQVRAPRRRWRRPAGGPLARERAPSTPRPSPLIPPQAIYTKGSNAKFANGTALTLQSLGARRARAQAGRPSSAASAAAGAPPPCAAAPPPGRAARRAACCALSPPAATNNPGSAYWDTYSAFFGGPGAGAPAGAALAGPRLRLRASLPRPGAAAPTSPHPGARPARRRLLDPKLCPVAPPSLPPPAGNPAWLDENIQRALSGEAPYTTDVARVQMLVKSLESATQSAAVMGLLDSAVALAK